MRSTLDNRLLLDSLRAIDDAIADVTAGDYLAGAMCVSRHATSAYLDICQHPADDVHALALSLLELSIRFDKLAIAQDETSRRLAYGQAFSALYAVRDAEDQINFVIL